RFDRLGFSGTIINEHNPSISSTDAAGNLLGFIESGDLSTILGGGYRLFSKSNIASFVGLSVKYFFQKKFNVTEHDILFDAGYLFQLYNNFRIGIVLKNFGTTMDYISIVPGISYKQSFDTDRLHLLEISAESSILLYFKKPSLLSFGNYLYYNRFQNGVELVLLRSVMFQLGYTLGFNVNSDRWGNDLYQTTEPKYVTTHSLPFGFGISLFNHFDFNYCFKNSFSFSVKRILTWKKSDLHWWRNIKE
ncbi:MAG: hypothetical protein GX640_23140, partial [Fibrobacter sp.]|nr:hypothetical protein [Fibrobacter sp.]